MKWFNIFQDKNHDGDLSATELTSRAELAFKVSITVSKQKNMFSFCLTFGNLEFYHISNHQNPLPILQRLHLIIESGQKQRRVFDKEGVLQTAAASDKGAGFGLNMTESCKIILILYWVLATGFDGWCMTLYMMYGIHWLLQNKTNIIYLITIIAHNPGGCRDAKVWRGWRRKVGLSGLFHLDLFFSMQYLGQS